MAANRGGSADLPRVKQIRETVRETDKKWHKLVQRYAIRAREFSDTVAALGRGAHFGPIECVEQLEEIRTRRALCDEAAEECPASTSFPGRAASGRYVTEA
jgi:hypothetical protein